MSTCLESPRKRYLLFPLSKPRMSSCPIPWTAALILWCLPQRPEKNREFTPEALRLHSVAPWLISCRELRGQYKEVKLFTSKED